MALVEEHCRICLRLDGMDHLPKCPCGSGDQRPEWIEIVNDNGSVMGSVTIWSREDLQAPFNRHRRVGD